MNVHDFIKLQCQCEVARLCGYNLYFENIFVLRHTCHLFRCAEYFLTSWIIFWPKCIFLDQIMKTDHFTWKKIMVATISISVHHWKTLKKPQNLLCFLAPRQSWKKDSQSQACHLVLIEKFFHCSGSHDLTCHVIICAAGERRPVWIHATTSRAKEVNLMWKCQKLQFL